MSIEEFSNQFDVLLDSYSQVAPHGEEAPISNIRLDEYEKSLFLTESQEDIVISLYNGRTGLSFEETEEARRYLAPLVQMDKESPISSTDDALLPISKASSTFFELPSDVWFITYEAVNLQSGKCDSMTSMEVVPVTQDEYHRIKKNPFRGANDRRALRLDLSTGVVEIICKYPVAEYYLRYIRKPEPIILAPLDGLTIRGKSLPRTSELHEALHQRILEGAVRMAIQGRSKATKQ